MDALPLVIQSALGRQRVQWIMEDYPSQYFSGRVTSFGIAKLPRKVDQEVGGKEEERFCLSMLPAELAIPEFKTAFARLFGLDLATLAQFPDSFGVTGKHSAAAT